MKNSSQQERVDKELIKDLKKIAVQRVANGLAKPIPSEISFKEMTRLITKTDAYQRVLEELKHKPKK